MADVCCRFDASNTLPAADVCDAERLGSAPRTSVRATTRSSCLPAATWVGGGLPDFEIQELVAEGGMGIVFRARDTLLDRIVAIKVIREELAGEPEYQELFLREARTQAQLDSPHIVRMYGAGRARMNSGARVSFLAMEYVEGGTLADLLERGGPLEAEDARRLMLEVAQGLLDAERRGIVHRDIKPGNLLLDGNGSVKIADFGLAKLVSEADSSPTLQGAVVGTPRYMAPEQARGDHVDQRADMYALGCTFYHLLSGRAPFQGDTPLAIIYQHLTNDPIPLAELNRDVPPSLRAIIERLMNKNPDRRYADCAELVRALEAAAPRPQTSRLWVRAAQSINLAVASWGLALW
jgi:serine/threonine-protein kinase